VTAILMEHIEEGRQTSGSSIPAAKRGQRLTRRRDRKLFNGVTADAIAMKLGIEKTAMIRIRDVAQGSARRRYHADCG
jgi:hypothetical protein